MAQSAYDFLTDLLSQLEARKERIRQYVKQEGQTISKRDFTENDIEKINQRIDEAAAAINGILSHLAQKKGKKTYHKVVTSNTKFPDLKA